MNLFVQCVRADKRTIEPVTICGWQLPRRVGPGCDLGRVVFQASAVEVNSSLASLWANYFAEFACGHSNDRMKIDHGLHPVDLTLG
jgi:hypothetical protein